MIVVDTNVICYRWMASPQSALAEAAFGRDPDWIAPLLWRSEFRNVLAGALRHRLVTLDAATEIAYKAEETFSGREFVVSSRAVMRLISQSRCSAYDCEFVALAEEQNISLLTGDRQILLDFPKRAISLEKFVHR
jgi:predicted nucleic acid-binding protein